MADPAKLFRTPPINGPDNSSQHSSFTLTIESDDGLHRLKSTSCGTGLDPSQSSCPQISDHQSPTSCSSRPPMLSHNNSEDEDPGMDVIIENSAIGTMREPMSRISGLDKFGSVGGYSRMTELPQHSRNFQSGNLLNKFRNRSHSRFEVVTKPPKRPNVLKFWKWEVFNCVLAIGILGSMYGVLQRYNGQRIPDWGATINLSTLIALMATLLRALLVFVVAEIIGQAKWRYFAGDGRPTERPPTQRLIEMSRFSNASQGSIGAVRLLPAVSRDPATLLALIVMVVSLGTGSFVQQAISTQSCQVLMDSANASLPISRNLTAGKGGGSSVFGALDIPNVLAALSSALAPDSEEIGSPISVGCPTGNCTFQSPIGGVHSTLGVCSSCADTSSLIASTGWALTREEYTETYDPDSGAYLVISASTRLTANYALPNGMSVRASFNNIKLPYYQTTEVLVSASGELGLDWAGDLVGLEMKALSQWAFANVTVLTSNWLPNSSGYTDYVAATCTLYPCLRSYKASVISGKLDEVLVSTVPAVPNVAAVFPSNITTEAIQKAISGTNWNPSIYSTDPGAHFQAVKSPCLVNDTVWTKGNQSFAADAQRLLLLHADPDPYGARNFTVENITAPAECIYGMDVVAVSDFRSFMQGTSLKGSCSAGSFVNSTGNTMQIDCAKKYWLARFYSEEGTTADSIIKRFEDFADRLSNKMRMGLLNNPEAVTGQVLQAIVCSRIHFVWLTFPAILVAVTSGLLAWTMFQNPGYPGREMVWKTSILPLLFYGDRFVVQNGEDVSAYSNEFSRRVEGVEEPLLDLAQMEAEARQRKVRLDLF